MGLGCSLADGREGTPDKAWSKPSGDLGQRGSLIMVQGQSRQSGNSRPVAELLNIFTAMCLF